MADQGDSPSRSAWGCGNSALSANTSIELTRAMIGFYPSFDLTEVTLHAERRPDEPVEVAGDPVTARVYAVTHTMKGQTIESVLRVDDRGLPLALELVTPMGVMTTKIKTEKMQPQRRRDTETSQRRRTQG